ncbi:MAG TPA: DUF2141 domain-containing protein [Deltaproteobacteria bacterium]|nr:DUF2141 domain-containing protein [Deltaproteobacteria bacterium]HPR56130.1 DUF2141 domain-containing protein [Deltaproteobacteria bacterium]HXK48321.1 DUF2141 domain-containing protein [Deltaproteobacteria bacterium]
MKLSRKTLVMMIVLLAGPCLAADPQGSGDLTIHVTGIKSTSGYLDIAVADSEPGFLEKDRSYTQIRTRVNGPEMSVMLKGLPFNDYAVSVFHDENANGTLDRNMRGAPKELLGYSNNVRGKSGPPQYTASRFGLRTNALTVTINLR